MLKIAGVLLCVLGSAGYGMVKIADWNNAVKELEQWILLLEKMKNCIYYRRDIVSDIFCTLDEGIYGIGGKYIATVGNELRDNRSGNLKQLWQERMNQWKQNSNLPGDVKKWIMDFPEYIGEQDYEQQINHLDFYLSGLRLEKEKLEKITGTRKKPVMALSLAGGITVSILLL